MKSCSAIILTADQFEDMEVFFPYFRLLEEGVKVHVAAPSKETIHGEHGYALKRARYLYSLNRHKGIEHVEESKAQ
jgi:protease I